MPVLYNGDDYRHHSTEDYSFVTRSDWSRDFARRRRFGDEDELYDRPMSQTSLPLRIGQVGSSSRRGYSPYEDCSPPRREERYRSTSPGTGRRSRLSGAVRQALAVCGELDEDDPYYKARLEISSPPPHYDEIDEDDDDDYVIVMKRRRKRPQSKIPHRKPEYFLDDASDIKNTDDHEWRKGLHRQQKLDHEQNTDLGYTIPISRRSFGKDQDQEEESDYRRITSYLAKRKQFAVEDDDVIQKMKNKKYEYKTKGPNRLFSDLDVEDESRRGIFAQAPMFVMKPRSHTVWEKMYVKFTCTIRGTPQPKVTWYHNMISIDPTTLMPGTMRISSQFGVHTLEIFQASLEDSGTYRVSAQNHKGEISSYATLIVRRYDGSKLGYYDVKSGYNLKKPTDFPDVETLDVPDENTEDHEKEHAQDKVSETTLQYASKSVEVGDGKYESVLMFQIPAKKLTLDGKQFSVESSGGNEAEPLSLIVTQVEECKEEKICKIHSSEKEDDDSKGEYVLEDKPTVCLPKTEQIAEKEQVDLNVDCTTESNLAAAIKNVDQKEDDGKNIVNEEVKKDVEAS